MELTHHSRVAIVGGGPAGSLTAYFMLDIARSLDIHINVEIYEPAQFAAPGPKGCNHCGGIISETLVQMLAMDGINLPPEVVQRGLDSYALHTEVGSVRIHSHLPEMRIASLYRGSGPLHRTTGEGGEKVVYQSFDGYLLGLAVAKGATVHPHRVTRVSRQGNLPVVSAKGIEDRTYDLVVGAVGVNGGGLKVFDPSALPFTPPRTTKAFVTEIYLGWEGVNHYFGNTMHVFLLQMPRVDFSAIIPKGEYVTVVMLGKDLNKEIATQILAHPTVRACFPAEVDLSLKACQCLPDVSLGMATPPFADRVVLVGDAAVSRLYKDGNGAAYRTAKALAITAMIHGISKAAFARYYRPACRALYWDNVIGRAVFLSVNLFKRVPLLTRGLLRLVRQEQAAPIANKKMSLVLWDTFTGSNSYRSIFLRCLHPVFLARLCLASLRPAGDAVADPPEPKTTLAGGSAG